MLVQILINAKGLNMNPLQSLYYVSPACLACLPGALWCAAARPATSLPARHGRVSGCAGAQARWSSTRSGRTPRWCSSPLSSWPTRWQPLRSTWWAPALAPVPAGLRVMLSRAAAAQAVFMLIGKTSALTMNIAGVIKDWMLIFLSYYLFQAPVTALNLFGYAFCCSGVRARGLGGACPARPAAQPSSRLSDLRGTPQVAVYNYQKLQILRAKAKQSAHKDIEKPGRAGELAAEADKEVRLHHRPWALPCLRAGLEPPCACLCRLCCRRTGELSQLRATPTSGALRAWPVSIAASVHLPGLTVCSSRSKDEILEEIRRLQTEMNSIPADAGKAN